MAAVDLLLAALVAIACGTLGHLTYSHGGWVVNAAIAFIGALAGAAVARSLHAPKIYDIVLQGTEFPIIYSVIGSVLFVGAIGFFIRPRQS